jgi:hypothetical protein
MYGIHIFLNETGCILIEKMLPDVTAMVPELETDKKNIENQYLNGQARNFQKNTYRKSICRWTNAVEQETSRPCAHKPTNF